MCPGPGAGRCYGVGCLSLLFVWFLIDLVCKAVFWGIASLFGVRTPALSKVVLCSAWAVLIPLGAIVTAGLIWMLYCSVLDFLKKCFRKRRGTNRGGRASAAASDPGVNSGAGNS